MIFPDHKKAAGMILAKLKDGAIRPGPEVKAEAQSDPHEQGLHAIAEDMMMAMHEKSAQGIVQAMKAFMAQHGTKSSTEE